MRTVPDMDGDELLDAEEATWDTNPLSRDTDWDGFTDGDQEVWGYSTRWATAGSTGAAGAQKKL